MLSQPSYYLKMSAGLARLQTSPRSDDPVEAIRNQLRHREDRFLQLGRAALNGGFYRELFAMAGCSYADGMRRAKGWHSRHADATGSRRRLRHA